MSVHKGIMWAMVTVACLAGGCAGQEASGARPPKGAAVIDSALPIEESLRRFREGWTEPTTLEGGARDREALVRNFVSALEARDTAALRRMVLSREEFAWLYYPSSALSRPPYELPPDLMWLQMQGESEKGASLLLADRAGPGLGYVGHSCGSSRQEEENRIYGHCVLRRLDAQRDTLGERLFGLIVERGGVYKFVSYANRLD